MSRSFHATHQQLAKLRRSKYADPAAHSAAIQKLRGELNRKYRTKRQVRRETSRERRPDPLLAPTDGTPLPLELLPIEIEDEGDQGYYVHHAASAADLRALLAALPPGLTDGLSRIVLLLGKQKMANRAASLRLQPDPLTGRHGLELIAGVYCAKLLGVYRVSSATIEVYAYTYNPEDLPLPRAACELYLRMRALLTFVHELAHHFDDTRRVARGRWLAIGKDRVERYAEAREYAWGREVTVPLLRRLYPEQVRCLENWIALHGGVRVTLEQLAGDPRRTLKKGAKRLRSDAGEAFEEWLRVKSKTTQNLYDTRIAFAEELHLSDQYDLCLRITDGLLNEWPPTCETWSLRADTLVHLRRYDEAADCAQRALDLNPSCLRAWQQLGWVAESRRQWHELLANADRQESLLAGQQKGNDAQRGIDLHRAVAFCGLGDLARMEEHLAKGMTRPEYISAWRKAVHRRAGMALPPPSAIRGQAGYECR